MPPKQQNGPDHAKSPVNKPNPDSIALVDMGKAKMYVVEVDKDDEEMRTMKGSILIKGKKINALFYSGRMHSIASLLVKSLGLQTSPLSKSFRLTMSTRNFEVTKLGVTNLPLDILRNTYVWSFIMYGLEGYDVLLGIDWLSANRTFLDYENKRVV